MKKTLATLLVAGALAAAGLSRLRAFRLAAATQVRARLKLSNWWPDSTKK